MGDQTGKQFIRRLKIAVKDVEQRQMVFDNVPELVIERLVFGLGHLKVDKRVRVIVGLEFAKSQQGQRRSILSIQLHKVAKGFHAVAIIARIVIKRPEIPPAFFPARVEPERLLIEVGRLWQPVLLGNCPPAPPPIS